MVDISFKLVRMGITIITSILDVKYETSKNTMKNLVDKIKNQKDRSSAKPFLGLALLLSF